MLRIMSHHYNASQYSDSFKPTRLNNYNPFNNTQCAPYGVHAMCLPNRCCPTQIIADDNGALFPCIPRGCSSPWGDFAYHIWEQPPAGDCCCVSRLRHPEKFVSPRPIYIAREEYDHEEQAAKVTEKVRTDGWGEPLTMCTPCCKPCPQPGGYWEDIPIKVIVCGNNPAERRRLRKEIRKQEQAFRRKMADARGRGRGKPRMGCGFGFTVGPNGCMLPIQPENKNLVASVLCCK